MSGLRAGLLPVTAGVHRRRDLPQARFRLGRELPDARRHALRVRRRTPRPAPVPVPVVRQHRCGRAHGRRSRYRHVLRIRWNDPAARNDDHPLRDHRRRSGGQHRRNERGSTGRRRDDDRAGRHRRSSAPVGLHPVEVHDRDGPGDQPHAARSAAWGWPVSTRTSTSTRSPPHPVDRGHDAGQHDPSAREPGRPHDPRDRTVRRSEHRPRRRPRRRRGDGVRHGAGVDGITPAIPDWCEPDSNRSSTTRDCYRRRSSLPMSPSSAPVSPVSSSCTCSPSTRRSVHVVAVSTSMPFKAGGFRRSSLPDGRMWDRGSHDRTTTARRPSRANAA